MPSKEHETVVKLIRSDPECLTDLLHRRVDDPLPAFDDIRVESNDLSQLKPTEFRADSVMTLVNARGDPVAAIVVEVQRSCNPAKRYAWPAYLATLRSRFRCDTLLVVVACNRRIASWADQPIEMGHPDWALRPLVVGPDQIPVITDPALVAQQPSLAVLSALAHARDDQRDLLFVALVEGLNRLDSDEANLYIEKAMFGLSDDEARHHLEALVESDAWEHRSDLANKYAAKGKAEGIIEILTARGLKVPARLHNRIMSCTDMGQLSDMVKRAVTVSRPDDLFA